MSLSLCHTFGVRQLVQVEHSTHLADLAASLTGNAAIVVDHVVAEILVEGFGLRQPEAQAQLQEALWLQVRQSKSLRHDIFKPPVGSLFLIGFRQIQIVLPDILQKERMAPRGGGGEEEKEVFDSFQWQKLFL